MWLYSLKNSQCNIILHFHFFNIVSKKSLYKILLPIFIFYTVLLIYTVYLICVFSSSNVSCFSTTWFLILLKPYLNFKDGGLINNQDRTKRSKNLVKELKPNIICKSVTKNLHRVFSKYKICSKRFASHNYSGIIANWRLTIDGTKRRL